MFTVTVLAEGRQAGKDGKEVEVDLPEGLKAPPDLRNGVSGLNNDELGLWTPDRAWGVKMSCRAVWIRCSEVDHGRSSCRGRSSCQDTLLFSKIGVHGRGSKMAVQVQVQVPDGPNGPPSQVRERPWHLA